MSSSNRPLLASDRAQTSSSDDPRSTRIRQALELARSLAQRSAELQTPAERRQQAELDRMLQHPEDKATLVELTDQSFRSARPHRSADQMTHVLDVQGVPRFFSPVDRTLLRGFQSFGGYLPGVAVPLVREKMQRETANVILPADPEELRDHLVARAAEGVHMNVNFLGEAILGEAEAARRLDRYALALRDPAIEVVSIKISTLFSQISHLARETTLDVLCDRLEILYRASLKNRFKRPDGTTTPKLVYLDMEEYRDMALTAEVFMRTLARSGLRDVTAGIALQAYIPDSFAVQREITAYARQRVAGGGAPLRVRVVKGANMEMEKVEASIHGWPLPLFRDKADTDANYKRMLEYGLAPDHAHAVHLGVASHNLFDLAYALLVAEDHGTTSRLQIEMLEGMANHQRRAIFERTGDLLLYAPACRREDFLQAIGYLVRRLDENTGPENFLRHAARLRVDSEAWDLLERAFVRAFERIPALPDTPRRTQDRRTQPVFFPHDRPFENEPPTDFSLPQNVTWATSIYEAWRQRCDDHAPFAPLVIDGEAYTDRPVEPTIDPSRPGVVASRHAVASSDDVQRAIDVATRDPDGWRTRPVHERGLALRAAAHELRRRRADLLGIALAEGGKVLQETDPEICEAVDFCEFYARSVEELSARPDLEIEGRGVVVVVSPWNFPIAIPCGGVAAALAAGNCVLLKPAPSTVMTAYMLCEAFWAAGISKRTLQFVYGRDREAATDLVTHPGVDTVLFTGGTETAMALLDQKPDLRLLAETGGKNAIIVTAMADRDLAIRSLVSSAFGHAGQKCSATSLAILEQEVYDDPSFRAALCDAVTSLHTGSAWEPRTKVSPLIRPPGPKLEYALKELEPDESWAVMPRKLEQNPSLYSPGIRWGVRPQSRSHTTEFFGPVLSVMRARDLEEAIALVHATGYGLTAGLQSLDDREHAVFAARLRAGNLYINRGTTGAIVQRQPFGGMAKSAVGPGLQAGGPNYVLSLLQIRDRDRASAGPTSATPIPELVALFLAKVAAQPLDTLDLAWLQAATASYAEHMASLFAKEHDVVRIVGQDNLHRYRPVADLRVRVGRLDSWTQILASALAAHLAGVRPTLSFGLDDEARATLLEDLTESFAGHLEIILESDEDLATQIRNGAIERVRYAGPGLAPRVVRTAAAAAGVYLAEEPVLRSGRVELLHYLREQSLSVDYHRYGNLGRRANEERRPID